MRWMLVMLLIAAPAAAQTRFYGRDGSLEGTARTGPGGETRFYGRDGGLRGTARPGSGGETRFYGRDGAFDGATGRDRSHDRPYEGAPRR